MFLQTVAHNDKAKQKLAFLLICQNADQRKYMSINLTAFGMAVRISEHKPGNEVKEMSVELWDRMCQSKKMCKECTTIIPLSLPSYQTY